MAFHHAISTTQSSVRWPHNPKIGESGLHRLADVAGRQMRVVPFGHAGVAMPKLCGDHRHRYALDGQSARVGVAQDVESDGGRYLRGGARRAYRAELVRTLPGFAIMAREQQGVRDLPYGPPGEE